MRSSAASMLFLSLIAAAPAAVIAQPAAQAVEARCDGREAAGIVQQAGNTISSLYHDLVMREPHETPADHRIYYGSNLQQFGDLRLPKGRGPFPVAVLVHGGGWGSAISLHYMTSLGATLACAGVATWNIEFRRVGSGGEWPGMFRDLGAGTDYVRQLALKYPLDISRGVVVVGHSSGGSLAMWVAMRHRLPSTSELYTPNPMPVAGGISLDGAVDMLRRLEDGPSVASTFDRLFANDGAAPSVVRQRMIDASPRHYLPLGIPQAIFQGNPGGTPWYGCCGTPEHVAEARALGDEIEYIIIEGAGHFESSDPMNPTAGHALRRIVRSMLGLER